jgi:glycosyltransferase involved in cell wall biosynthesis
LQRIVVSVTNDLITDQRVDKICSTLVDMNFDILLIGRKLPTSLSLSRNYETFRMKLLFNSGVLFYAEYSLRLFFKLLFLKKDILLSNDLDTLLPNFLISKLVGKKLVYDSHELFTEIPELIDRPKVQKVWLKIEKTILPKVKNCYTASDSIARYYEYTYNSDFKIVRNVPYSIGITLKSNFPFDIENKKIILYQGSVNLCRGIDLMIESMQFVENALFIIIGDGDLLKEMKLKVDFLKLNHKVKFLASISPKKLHTLTPLADLGISLEEDKGLSYRYALPNKLFDYIQAKIPVIVSNLPEMRKIIDEYKVGKVLYERSPKNLAKMVIEMLEIGKKPWQESLHKASDELVWENEKMKIKKIFQNLK